MEKIMKNKLLTALFGVMVALLILTASIGLPIYVRQLYYMQIDTLYIVEYSGFDEETIKEAYDEMIEYCTIPWAQFGTGELRYSESGKSHFEDCKGLFLLNGAVLIISLVSVIALLVLCKLGIFELLRPRGFDVTFYSASGLLGTFLVVAGLAAIDFNTAFVIFHTLFFPGKDNWMFDPRTDQIIMILPQDFFMNCAILIVSSIIILSLAFIILGVVRREKTSEK